jgi:predicted metal-binding membrane protein
LANGAASGLWRDRGIVVGGLALLGALAWVYLLHLHAPMTGTRMEAMGMGGAMTLPQPQPWQGGDLLVAFLMWVVMMVAMMTPSATPLLLLVTTVSRQRQRGLSPAAVAASIFTGYVAVWTGFSLAATLVQWGLQSAAWLSPAMNNLHPPVAGVVLVAAGAYQFTPWKYACLVRCRTPLGFLIAEWREGTTGALRMGVRHGLYCVGCCWLLMALLFAVGVMNLLWVVLIAGYVLVEKLAPGGWWVSRAIGVLLVGRGLWMLLALA